MVFGFSNITIYENGSTVINNKEQKKLKDIQIPKETNQVKDLLRKMGAPITLFGEKDPERKMRLKQLITGVTEDELNEIKIKSNIWEKTNPSLQNAIFYKEGQMEVKKLRLWITKYGLGKSNKRIANQIKRKSVVVENLEKYWATEKIDGLTVVADERPVSCCAFCPDGKSLITAGWTGRLKIWSLPECSNTLALKAHEERITGIAANPEFGTAHFYGPAFATGSADHTLRVWNSEGSLITTFSEHCERLGHVAFHPSGRLLASASFDHSWCIWSMEKESLSLSSKTQIEKKYKKLHLQVHENHGKPIYSIAFHPDGCLLGSGGMDSNGRLWDIRTGNNVVALEGHSCTILTLAFSPNGYHLVTGSMDNTCQV
eukprot:gnl/TRDRNA2_/TRDRNA2_177339_c0_seq6.p1 gnl/TRDRNA2_/TRDRNA2_177339_c0~~gnl/TRDRNA2_/TRDRNA2_177339_c0_seq6.p1  ORF type:complete len:373 (+),score=-7.24 gnl/TRDRNA2_/TRDRNA2_177339_c0_seq6:60-1178(+)